MVPIVILEQWLNRLTEETFLGKLRWTATTPLHENLHLVTVFNGYEVVLAGCEEGIRMDVVQYVTTMGFPVAVLSERIIKDHFLHQKVAELYQFAESASKRAVQTEETKKLMRAHAAIVNGEGQTAPTKGLC